LSSAFAQESDVLTLTSENFDQTIRDNQLILVEFYAPWCGHCKKLAPEYERAATILKEVGIPIAQVDADDAQNAELRNRFGIKGFPTIKLFRNGEPSDYQAERSADALVSFMKKQAAPAVTELNNEAETKTFSESRVAIVGFFDNRDSEEYSQFKTIANAMREQFSFGDVVGKANVNEEFGVKKTPQVILFKQFDEKQNILESENYSDLRNFITKNSVPVIDEIGPHNYKLYVESGLPMGYLFVDLTVSGQKDEFVAKVYDVAKDNKGKMNWVFIDSSKYAKHAERLGLSGKIVPAIAIEKTDDGTHFAYDESAQITSESVKEWVEKFLKGEVPPTIKSEDIPASNDQPVKVVVAKSFDAIVMDTTKDVFVEFYAPWCGHCKKLAPIFDELAQAFSGASSVVIAKIDATANDVSPKFGVRGFPTLKLFPANNKESPIDYNGDRSLPDMTNFIKQHASVQIDLGKDEL